jgi:hypothetical protein
MTPLFFEVCSGAFDACQCSFPIRAFLRTTRFIEAAVLGVDLGRRVVLLGGGEERGELAYDQLVFALGVATGIVGVLPRLYVAVVLSHFPRRFHGVPRQAPVAAVARLMGRGI